MAGSVVEFVFRQFVYLGKYIRTHKHKHTIFFVLSSMWVLIFNTPLLQGAIVGCAVATSAEKSIPWLLAVAAGFFFFFNLYISLYIYIYIYLSPLPSLLFQRKFFVHRFG